MFSISSVKAGRRYFATEKQTMTLGNAFRVDNTFFNAGSSYVVECLIYKKNSHETGKVGKGYNSKFIAPEINLVVTPEEGEALDTIFVVKAEADESSVNLDDYSCKFHIMREDGLVPINVANWGKNKFAWTVLPGGETQWSEETSILMICKDRYDREFHQQKSILVKRTHKDEKMNFSEVYQLVKSHSMRMGQQTISDIVVLSHYFVDAAQNKH
jgi:hypothetical protein